MTIDNLLTKAIKPGAAKQRGEKPIVGYYSGSMNSVNFIINLINPVKTGQAQ